MKAKASSIRIAPRKLIMIVDEIRGKKINDAIVFLRSCPRKRAAETVYQLLKSAVANADQKGTVDVDTLVVNTIHVGKGATLKRFRPRAKGSAYPINKRTSHVWLTLAEK